MPDDDNIFALVKIDRFAIGQGRIVRFRNRYVITIDCIQCGFCCRRGCSKYNKVDCIIREGGKNGNPVGKITKRATQNLMEIAGDADTYDIEFPRDATPDEKLTLIMAGLFIDYRYFESTGGGYSSAGYRRRVYH